MTDLETTLTMSEGFHLAFSMFKIWISERQVRYNHGGFNISLKVFFLKPKALHATAFFRVLSGTFRFLRFLVFFLLT